VGGRPLAVDHRFHRLLENQLRSGGDEGGKRQAEPSGNSGDDRHNGSDYEHTELLDGPKRRVQPAGEIVDSVEKPFLPAGHCSVADDQNACQEHTETGRGGDRIAASPSPR
jgi:hypothetical protein